MKMLKNLEQKEKLLLYIDNKEYEDTTDNYCKIHKI